MEYLRSKTIGFHRDGRNTDELTSKRLFETISPSGISLLSKLVNQARRPVLLIPLKSKSESELADTNLKNLGVPVNFGASDTEAFKKLGIDVSVDNDVLRYSAGGNDHEHYLSIELRNKDVTDPDILIENINKSEWKITQVSS